MVLLSINWVTIVDADDLVPEHQGISSNDIPNQAQLSF